MTDRKTSPRSCWSFPCSKETTTQAAPEEIIRQSLWTLLSTEPGERVLHSDYGCSIKQYAFEIIDSVMESKLREEIERKVMLFEPRVELKEVSFKVNNEKDVLFIYLDYIIRQTNQRTSMVYPLHLTQMQDCSVL